MMAKVLAKSYLFTHPTDTGIGIIWSYVCFHLMTVMTV